VQTRQPLLGRASGRGGDDGDGSPRSGRGGALTGARAGDGSDDSDGDGDGDGEGGDGDGAPDVDVGPYALVVAASVSDGPRGTREGVGAGDGPDGGLRVDTGPGTVGSTSGRDRASGRGKAKGGEGVGKGSKSAPALRAEPGAGSARPDGADAGGEGGTASGRKARGGGGGGGGGGVGVAGGGGAGGGGPPAGPAKDFVSRNVELAGKVRHRGLTKEEEDRLREIIGPELMGDPDSEGEGEAGDPVDPVPRRTRKARGAVGAVSGDGLGDGDLPLALRVPGFEPPADDRQRLLELEDRLQGMVKAGTACEAASDPYPRPLKLFPVFLTALESKVGGV
jgi:hypothetical protein